IEFGANLAPALPSARTSRFTRWIFTGVRRRTQGNAHHVDDANVRMGYACGAHLSADDRIDVGARGPAGHLHRPGRPASGHAVGTPRRTPIHSGVIMRLKHP